MLYFAYGSNLDESQMRARCAGADPVGCAVLHDHALAFGGFSRTWGGAVASIVEARGARVCGLLYDIGESDLKRLDRFEGHPRRYLRVTKLVVGERGRAHDAQTYVLPRRGFEPGAPPAAYLDVLRRAYERLGLDDASLLAAAGVSSRPANGAAD